MKPDSKTFRGTNDKRVRRHDNEQLLVDTLDVGLFSTGSAEIIQTEKPLQYRANDILWNDIITGKIGHGDSIELIDFNFLEWLPSSPGRYFSEDAAMRRKDALKYFSIQRMEFAPLGKLEMIFGGIGSVRLAPRFIRGGEVAFINATSSGVSHEGIPIITPLMDSLKLINKIKTSGAIQGSVKGTLWPIPYEKSPVEYDRGIPKYYLFAKQFQIKDNAVKKPIVTVAITYNSTYGWEGKQLEVIDNHPVNPSKNWSFASFNPCNGRDELTSTVQWLKQYVARYNGSDTSILGDFDEVITHFENPIDFKLSDILEGKYSSNLLSYYCSKYGITIKQEFIMGDKFENITGSTIINKSSLVNSFNKIKNEYDEETANALNKLGELVNKSGNKEAGELFNAFNEELTQKEPKKSMLKSFWDGLLKLLPSISTTIGIVEKVTKLFSP